MSGDISYTAAVLAWPGVVPLALRPAAGSAIPVLHGRRFARQADRRWSGHGRRSGGAARAGVPAGGHVCRWAFRPCSCALGWGASSVGACCASTWTRWRSLQAWPSSPWACISLEYSALGSCTARQGFAAAAPAWPAHMSWGWHSPSAGHPASGRCWASYSRWRDRAVPRAKALCCWPPIRPVWAFRSSPLRLFVTPFMAFLTRFKRHLGTMEKVTGGSAGAHRHRVSLPASCRNFRSGCWKLSRRLASSAENYCREISSPSNGAGRHSMPAGKRDLVACAPGLGLAGERADDEPRLQTLRRVLQRGARLQRVEGNLLVRPRDLAETTRQFGEGLCRSQVDRIAIGDLRSARHGCWWRRFRRLFRIRLLDR